MPYKRYLLLLLLFTIVTYAYAQEKYIHFDVSSSESGEIKEVQQSKFVYVYSSIGYVNVRPTELFKTSAVPLYYRAYFNVRGKSKLKVSKLNAPIYLAPNQEYFIDIFNGSTLIKKYILKRPKLLPVVQFFDAKKANKPFYSTPDNGKIGQIEISSNLSINLAIDHSCEFKNLLIEYTLLNLKTKQQQHGTGLRSLKGLKFNANTDYELRVNYLVQKESVSVTYIHIKPHWYQSSFTYILLSVVLVSLAFAILLQLFKKRIGSSKKEQQKLTQAAIRLQSLLNPHFTFNALSSIQGLMNTDRIDEANQYLEEFSSLLRKTLAKSQQVFNSLDQELEMMRLYLKLEALRFNFTWSIEVDGNIELSLIEIPTLLLQPMIENAIKHGLAPLGVGGRLSIICKTVEKKDTFVIIVKDNGHWLNHDSNTGYGLSLTHERIATINQMKKEQDITLHFDKQDGTAAIFTFHHWI